MKWGTTAKEPVEFHIDTEQTAGHGFSLAEHDWKPYVPKQYSFPEGHWNWPVNLTHHHAVRAGDLIFTGGQVDLDTQGSVRNIGDLDQQCRNAMSYMATLLEDLSADFSDLVRLVVYYVGDANDEARLLDLLATIIGPKARPVVNMINMPGLCYPGMLTEIEGVAMRAPDGARIPRQCFYLEDMAYLPPTFSHVIRSGEMIFTGDMSALSPHKDVVHKHDMLAQTKVMMGRLIRALAAADAEMKDVVKINTFYRGGGSAEDWGISAGARASYFDDPGPAATGIPLPDFPHEGLMVKTSATAICRRNANGEAGAETGAEAGAEIGTRRYAWPKGHWDWSAPMPYKHGNICGKIIHIGGQVSLDITAKVIHPDDMVAQTKVSMENLKQVLAEFGATLDDVVKVTTFYQGSASAKALHENLLIRSDAYTAPGPATTGIPVPELVYESMVIEIEAIAVLD